MNSMRFQPQIVMCAAMYKILLLLVATRLCRAGYYPTLTVLNDLEKEDILKAHNHLRGSVSPTAANMRKVEWSTDLAEIAQNYSQRCIFNHNIDRTDQQKTLTFDYVGENLAITTSNRSDYVALINGWYSEVRGYSIQTGTCSRVCGHYTQLAWASTTHVGCGAIRCKTAQGFNFPNSLLLVCNYGIGSDNGRPYQTGEPCSACPPEYSLCTSNLCTRANQPSDRGGTLPDSQLQHHSSVLVTVGVLFLSSHFLY